MKNVYQLIADVSLELAKEGIEKGRNNQQQGYKFRGIDEFPSYLFAECGSVFSLHSNRFLSPLNVPNGYQHVVLVEGGIKNRFALHRLIARAFHGEPPKKAVVNHKNGVRTDNRAINLEWTTQSHNVKDAYIRGTRVIDDKHKTRCAELGRAKRVTTEKQEQEMRAMFSGARGEIERIAKHFGVSRYVVSRVINGV